jgi:hypothetical protein
MVHLFTCSISVFRVPLSHPPLPVDAQKEPSKFILRQSRLHSTGVGFLWQNCKLSAVQYLAWVTTFFFLSYLCDTTIATESSTQGCFPLHSVQVEFLLLKYWSTLTCVDALFPDWVLSRFASPPCISKINELHPHQGVDNRHTVFHTEFLSVLYSFWGTDYCVQDAK